MDEANVTFERCHDSACRQHLRPESFTRYRKEDKLLNTKAFEEWNWDGGKQYFVKHSIIDYRPLVFETFLTNVLAIEDEATAKIVHDYRFNLLEFAKTNMGLLK